MAKRGRKPLQWDFENWRPIYQDVWDLVASGAQFIEACHEVGGAPAVSQLTGNADAYPAGQEQGMRGRHLKGGASL
jgi:hypothetical protein